MRWPGVLSVAWWNLRHRQPDEIAGNYALRNLYYAPPRGDGLRGEDVDLLVPHQANMRIIEATAKYSGIPMTKVFVNVDRYGNTSSATIPVALDEAVEQGRLAAGMNVLLVAFGAGFTWGAMAVRW